MRFSYWTMVFAVAFIARAAYGREVAPEGSVPGSPSRLEFAQASEAAPRPPLDDLLAHSRELSRSGQPEKAYQLLLAAEDTYIGTIEFDYALGRAALEAGRPDKATLAFTRVLALDPAHAGASIDMGRAYLALGDFARARTMFQGLLALDPPPEVRSQLQAFLDLTNAPVVGSITADGAANQGYLAVMVGRSSNVNQSPSQSVIFVPGLGSNFQLSAQNVKIPDSFAGIAGGAGFSRPLDRAYSFVFGGEFLDRWNFHESDFDLAGVNLYLGLAATLGQHAWRIQAFAGRDWLGSSPSRDLDGLTATYVDTLNTDTQLLATAQGGQIRAVTEDLKVWDSDYAAVGAGAAHKIGERSTVFGIFSTGKLDDVGGSPSGNKHWLGMRVGSETAIAPRVKLTAMAAGEWGQFDKFDTEFQVERRDIRQAYDLGAQYSLDRAWSLRFGFSYVRQDSNIPLYAYTRSEWVLMLRRDFR